MDLGKNIAIVCAGEDHEYEKIRNYCRGNYIIAVDGGLVILDKLSIKPDFFIGDLDSISEDILKKYLDLKKEIYQKEKDYTDSELALRYAIKLKPEKIFILSATGSYFDHSLANVINLIRNYDENIETKLITKNSEIFVINKKFVLNDYAGRRFSLFPFEEISGFNMSGCKYNFNEKKDLKLMDYSISNVITDKKAVFNFKKGKMILILFDENFF